MDLETLASAAAELAERMTLLATLTALPGDSAVIWLEHRDECRELANLISGGLLIVGTPQ